MRKFNVKVISRIILLVLSFALLSLLLVGCGNSSDTNTDTGNAVVTQDDKFMNIPLSTVTDKVKKYSFNADGVNVKYFLVKGKDGEVRTAFDACDVCGGSKGYVQVGTDIKCNKCGRSFKIDGLGTQNKGSGCWPSYLSHQIENGNLIISKGDLAKGSHWFT